MNFKIFILFLVLLGSFWTIYKSHNSYHYGSDYLVYQHAGAGDYTWTFNDRVEGTHSGYYYKTWLSPTWLLFNEFWKWQILLILSFLVIAWKLLQYEYGWLVLLAVSKLLSVELMIGNVLPILIALSFYWWGVPIAGLFKPYMLIFSGIFIKKFWKKENASLLVGYFLLCILVDVIAFPDASILVQGRHFFRIVELLLLVPLIQVLPKKIYIPLAIIGSMFSLYGWI